jgi:uncharacterized protein YndB with AHSA1/START domain
MTCAHATIHVSRDFDHPVAAIFAHWTSPETRVRWEAGPDTGMRYDAFDTRPGAVETVRVFDDTAEIGHMLQRIHAVAPEALVSSVEGHFGGALTMVMIVSVRFVACAGGCRLEAVAQVTDLTGRDPKEQHEAGWNWLL